MRIGVPREIKDGERRVGLTPDGVRALVADGHAVSWSAGAALPSDSPTPTTRRRARDRGAPRDVSRATWSSRSRRCSRPNIRASSPGSTVFGFAQINRDPRAARRRARARACGIGYETVRDAAGGLPLLAPMSRIAGRLAPLVGGAALATDRAAPACW